MRRARPTPSEAAAERPSSSSSRWRRRRDRHRPTTTEELLQEEKKLLSWPLASTGEGRKVSHATRCGERALGAPAKWVSEERRRRQKNSLFSRIWDESSRSIVGEVLSIFFLFSSRSPPLTAVESPRVRQKAFSRNTALLVAFDLSFPCLRGHDVNVLDIPPASSRRFKRFETAREEARILERWMPRCEIKGLLLFWPASSSSPCSSALRSSPSTPGDRGSCRGTLF